MTFTPIHVSDRLFSKVSRYFGSAESAITEAVQNAYRSYCSHAEAVEMPTIDIRWDAKATTLTIEDRGRGIRDAGAMLSLASSDWGVGVEESQDPAGLGVCALLAWCDSVTWTSAFGTLTVHGERFFNNAAYRADLANQVQPDTRDVGTKVTLQGLRWDQAKWFRGVPAIVESAARWYTGVRVYLNGGPVARGIDSASYVTTVRNCPVYIKPGSTDTNVVLWYGHAIPTHGIVGRLSDEENLLAIHSLLGIIVDASGCPHITPKLPDRTELVQTEETAQFLAEVFTETAKTLLNNAKELCRGVDKNAMTYPAYSNFVQRYSKYIIGYGSYVLRTLGMEVREKRTVKVNKHDDGIGCEKYLNKTGSATVSCETVLLIDAKTKTIRRSIDVASHAGAIVFDEGGDDPIVDSDYDVVWGNSDEEDTYVLAVDVGEADANRQVIANLAPTLYLAELDEAGGIQNLLPLGKYFDNMYFTDVEVDDITSLIDDVTIISSGRSVDAAVNNACHTYNSWWSYEVQNSWDGDTTMDEFVTSEINPSWERVIAKALGCHAVTLPVYTLRSLGGSRFTLDLERDELIKGDGTVVKLRIQRD